METRCCFLCWHELMHWCHPLIWRTAPEWKSHLHEDKNVCVLKGPWAAVTAIMKTSTSVLDELESLWLTPLAASQTEPVGVGTAVVLSEGHNGEEYPADTFALVCNLLSMQVFICFYTFNKIIKHLFSFKWSVNVIKTNEEHKAFLTIWAATHSIQVLFLHGFMSKKTLITVNRASWHW